MDFEVRATKNFEKANAAVAEECEQLIAGLAAKRMLRSGGTAKLAVKIFERQSSQALQQTLAEMGKRIEHRGKRWSEAAEEIARALGTQIESAPVILARPLGLAGIAKGTAAKAAVDRLVAEAAERLRDEHSEFVDGWTAPIPATWKERHPYLHDIGLLVGGGAISLIFAWAGGFLGVK